MTTGLDLNDIRVNTVPRQCSMPMAPSIWRLVLRDERIIVPLNASSKGPSLYCIHSIGGDLHGYDRLANVLGDQLRIFGVQVPKSMMREGAAPSIETMARRYADALIRFQPDGPFIIAGYSAGAVIGLEVAQQLRALGKDVPMLVAFDGAPLTTQTISRRSLPVWRLFCKTMWRLASARPRDFRIESLRSRLDFKRTIKGEHSSSPERQMERDAVCKIAIRGGWSETQKRFILDTYKAMKAYSPSAYPGKVILFEAVSQPILEDLRYGDVWRSLTCQCEIVRVWARHSDFFDSVAGLKKIALHFGDFLHKLASQPADCDMVH